jgi:tetratricopeptide (TPR) repeat protein
VLDAAIAAGPDYAFEALFLRGQLTRLEGRPREALADLQAALAMSPSMVEAQRELALCLEADPEDVEAAELLG